MSVVSVGPSTSKTFSAKNAAHLFASIHNAYLIDSILTSRSSRSIPGIPLLDHVSVTSLFAARISFISFCDIWYVWVWPFSRCSRHMVGNFLMLCVANRGLCVDRRAWDVSPSAKARKSVLRVLICVGCKNASGSSNRIQVSSGVKSFFWWAFYLCGTWLRCVSGYVLRFFESLGRMR